MYCGIAISSDLAQPAHQLSLAAATEWPAGAVVARGWELDETPSETPWGWTARVRRLSTSTTNAEQPLRARAEWYRGSPALLQRLRAAVLHPPAFHPRPLAHHSGEGELLVVLPEPSPDPISPIEEATALTAALAHLHDQGTSGVSLEKVGVCGTPAGPLLTSLRHLASPAPAARDVARVARRVATLLPSLSRLQDDTTLDATALWRRVQLPEPEELSPIPPPIGTEEAVEHLTDLLVPGRATRLRLVSIVAPPRHGGPRVLAELNRTLRSLHGPIVVLEREDGTRRSLVARWLDDAAREIATFAPDGLREVVRAIRAIAEPWANELVALAPHLAHFDLGSEGAQPEHPAPASAIANLLRVMGTARHPLVLLAQSNRRLDRLTVAVLEDLSANPQPGHLYLGLLLPPAELSSLRDLVTSEVVIDPLDVYGCEALIEAALPGEVVDASMMADTLLAASGGAVDHAWALLRQWREAGVVQRAFGVWRCRALPLPSESQDPPSPQAVRLLQLLRLVDADPPRSGIPAQGALAELISRGFAEATPTGGLRLTELGWSPEIPSTTEPAMLRELHRQAVQLFHEQSPEHALLRLRHEELGAAPARDPSLAERHASAARDLLIAGAPEGALWHLDRSLERSPADCGCSETHHLIGLAYADLGDWERAGAAWTRAAEVSPNLLTSLEHITIGVRRLNISGAWSAASSLAKTGLRLAGVPAPSSLPATLAAVATHIALPDFWRTPPPPEVRDALCGLYIPLASSSATREPLLAGFAVMRAWQLSQGLVSPNAAVVKGCAAALLDVVDPMGFTGWSPQTLLSEALAMGEVVGTSHARAIAHHCASLVAFTSGNIETGLQQTDLAVQHALDGQRPLLAALVRLTGLGHARHHSRLDTLQGWLDQVDRIAPSFAPSTTSLRLLIRAKLGDPTVGTAITVHAAQLAEPVSNVTVAWTAHVWLAEAAAVRKQVEVAAEQLILAEAQIGRLPDRTLPKRELMLAKLSLETAHGMASSERRVDQVAKGLSTWPDASAHLQAHRLLVGLEEGTAAPEELREALGTLATTLPWVGFTLASACPSDQPTAKHLCAYLRKSLALPRAPSQAPRDDRDMFRQIVDSLAGSLGPHTTTVLDMPWPLSSKMPRDLLRRMLLEQLLVATHGCSHGQPVTVRLQVTPESMGARLAGQLGGGVGNTAHRFFMSVKRTASVVPTTPVDASALRELVDGLGGRVIQQRADEPTVEVWLPEHPAPQQAPGIVFVVHPDRRVREALRATLSGLGHRVEAANVPDGLASPEGAWAFVAPEFAEMVPCPRVVPVLRRNEDPAVSGPSLTWPCTVDQVARQLDRGC